MSVLKTFAFRCDWVTQTGEPDGSSYGTDKARLLAEISRRSMHCGDKASEVKVVVVDFSFWAQINKLKTKFVSTLEGHHNLDFSK